MTSLAVALHSLTAVFWVGGIFFAYMVMRPVSVQLEPPARLQLWSSIYARFFPWVWLFIGVLVISGYVDMATRFGGFSTGPLYLLAMQVVGWVMIALFAWLYFVLFKRLRRAVAAGLWPEAAAVMHPIRRIMLTNLSLGALITVIGVSGPFLG